jgi:hypothetical protein
MSALSNGSHIRTFLYLLQPGDQIMVTRGDRVVISVEAPGRGGDIFLEVLAGEAPQPALPVPAARRPNRAAAADTAGMSAIGASTEAQ